jgi:ankyrin repeat protein
LEIACEKGYTEIVRLLLQKGASIKATYNRFTHLYVACQNGHTEIVRLLLEKGAKIEATYKGYTPLHMACEKGYAEIVKLLLEKGANIYIKNDEEKSPLCIASERENTFIFDILFEFVVL